jgi:hypothetical protein
VVVLNYLKSGHYSCENEEETASGVAWVMENNINELQNVERCAFVQASASPEFCNDSLTW